MEPKAPVHTQYEEVQIVSQTYTCASGNLLEEGGGLDGSVLEQRIELLGCLGLGLFTQVNVPFGLIPHVAGIQEQCAIKTAEKAFAILEDMAEHGKIDKDIFESFRESNAWLRS